MEGVCSCLHQARINFTFWAKAVQYLVYTQNRTGIRFLSDYTPFEAYFGVPPFVAHLRPFGCPTFVHIPAHLRRKLDPKAQHGIFVGYFDESKVFRIWIPDKSRVVTSRDVTFDEEKIVQYNVPESQSANTHPSLISSLITNVTTPPLPPPVILYPPQFSPNHNFNSISTVSIPSLPSPITEQEIFQRLSTPDSSSNDDPYDFSTPSQPIHPVSPPRPMVPVSIQNTVVMSSSPELSRRGVNPPVRCGGWYYAFSAMAGTLPPVPKSYKEALQSSFAPQWQVAMDEEFNSLITNKTWKLTHLPLGRKAICSKWV